MTRGNSLRIVITLIPTIQHYIHGISARTSNTVDFAFSTTLGWKQTGLRKLIYLLKMILNLILKIFICIKCITNYILFSINLFRDLNITEGLIPPSKEFSHFAFGRVVRLTPPSQHNNHIIIDNRLQYWLTSFKNEPSHQCHPRPLQSKHTHNG